MIRFAVFTDLHYDSIPDGEQRLKEFIDSIQGEKLDFVLSLGDLCHPIAQNGFLLSRLREHNFPIYFLVGNHDSDQFSHEEWKKFVGVANTYQSFSKDNIKFILLNSCYMKKEDGFAPYYKQNYIKKENLYPVIPDDEINWLKNEMSREDMSYVIFSHHSLANEFADRGIKNRAKIQEILSSRHTILCMNGHDHGQDCRIINGICYYTLNAMSYIWHGSNKIDCYPKELLEQYPLLKDIILYKTEQHCIVEIQDHSLSIQGMPNDYLYLTPEEAEITNRMWNGVSVEPGIMGVRREI